MVYAAGFCAAEVFPLPIPASDFPVANGIETTMVVPSLPD